MNDARHHAGHEIALKHLTDRPTTMMLWDIIPPNFVREMPIRPKT